MILGRRPVPRSIAKQAFFLGWLLAASIIRPRSIKHNKFFAASGTPRINSTLLRKRGSLDRVLRID